MNFRLKQSAGWMAMVLVFMFAWAAKPACAQEFRGTLSGTVTDPTGAVIPGAAVVAVETHTGTTNRTT
jgi:hypothetical protein